MAKKDLVLKKTQAAGDIQIPRRETNLIPLYCV